MQRVITARPYSWATLPAAEAQNMLVKQSKFPDEYDEEAGDRLACEYIDRLYERDSAHWHACVRKHLGEDGPRSLSGFLRDSDSRKVLAFLKDIMRADPKERWTGFRVLRSLNHSTMAPYYVFELFSKGKDSSTLVFSGERAPNVRGYSPPRRKDDKAHPFGIDWPNHRHLGDGDPPPSGRRP